jgi:dTDP-4-amino-4,6-dideoxygalactose transaminase
MKKSKRIFLSPPYAGNLELAEIQRAFASGYIAPCGPQVDEFENLVAQASGRKYCVAVSSATAALDLLMEEFGVDSSWTVIAPSMTFIATVGPAYKRGGKIVFVDSDKTGNISVVDLEKALCSVQGKKMVIGVDLYGRCCDYKKIEKLCLKYDAVLIMDSAESFGATRGVLRAGSIGKAAVFSFNGNKIITTSGGGALVTDDEGIAQRARKRSTQSRENVSWYEHTEVGFNYRMSNIVAAIGIGQIKRLPEILAKKSLIAERYDFFLSKKKGISFLPHVAGENNWLNVILLKSSEMRDEALERLSVADIEARHLWKPLHLQPVFSKSDFIGKGICEDYFNRGLCLPSGAALSEDDIEKIVRCVLGSK